MCECEDSYIIFDQLSTFIRFETFSSMVTDNCSFVTCTSITDGVRGVFFTSTRDCFVSTFRSGRIQFSRWRIDYESAFRNLVFRVTVFSSFEASNSLYVIIARITFVCQSFLHGARLEKNYTRLAQDNIQLGAIVSSSKYTEKSRFKVKRK